MFFPGCSHRVLLSTLCSSRIAAEAGDIIAIEDTPLGWVAGMSLTTTQNTPADSEWLCGSEFRIFEWI
jgi:hypothetical protein